MYSKELILSKTKTIIVLSFVQVSLGILSEHMLWVQSSDNNLDHENLSRRLQCFPLVDMKSAQILSGINPDHRHQSEILALLENYEDKRVFLFLIFLTFLRQVAVWTIRRGSSHRRWQPKHFYHACQKRLGLALLEPRAWPRVFPSGNSAKPRARLAASQKSFIANMSVLCRLFLLRKIVTGFVNNLPSSVVFHVVFFEMAMLIIFPKLCCRIHAKHLVSSIFILTKASEREVLDRNKWLDLFCVFYFSFSCQPYRHVIFQTSLFLTISGHRPVDSFTFLSRVFEW